MRRYAYSVSLLGHAVLLTLLVLVAPRVKITPPILNVMSVELVKPIPSSVPAPQLATPQPQADVVPRIVPRLTPAPAVALRLDPLPLPAQPLRLPASAPTKTAVETLPPVTPPPQNAVFDPGKPLSRQEPEYPDEAARRGTEGTVELRFTILADGTTSDIRIVNSDPPGIFDAAALRSQRTARYTPPTSNGVAVDQPNCRVIFRFKAPR